MISMSVHVNLCSGSDAGRILDKVSLNQMLRLPFCHGGGENVNFLCVGVCKAFLDVNL